MRISDWRSDVCSSDIRMHIKPALGGVSSSGLRPQEAQRFVATLTLSLGAGTTHSDYAVLRSALRTAADLELIDRAPIRGVRLPSIPKTRVTILHLDELVRLADAVPKIGREHA